MILKIILVMTCGYKKSCGASQTIYRGCLSHLLAMKPKGSTMATFKLLFLIWKLAVVLRQLFCDNVNKGSEFIGVDWVFDADWVIFVISHFQLLSCGYKVFIFIIVGWPTRSGYPRFKIYTSKKVSYEVTKAKTRVNR